MPNKGILFENQEKRMVLPVWQHVCFVMFCIWQMGFIYFMGPSLTIDGKTPLPISMDNITLLIVAGYVCTIITMMFRPDRVVRMARLSAITALVSAAAFFAPLADQVMMGVIYLHCFCCCYMIGFETAMIVYFFSEKSAIRHLLVIYPMAYAAIGVIQNDFAPISFAWFRSLTVIMLALLVLFYFKMPGKTMPRFVRREDGLMLPKHFFAGVFILSFLSALLGVIGPAVAAETRHGVVVLYVGSAVWTLGLYGICRITQRHPIHLVPVIIVIAVMGYIMMIFSAYVQGISDRKSVV